MDEGAGEHKNEEYEFKYEWKERESGRLQVRELGFTKEYDEEGQA